MKGILWKEQLQKGIVKKFPISKFNGLYTDVLLR